MSKTLSILFLMICIQAEGQFAQQDITLLSRFDDPNVIPEPVFGVRYQGCWGWVNPADGREYGIIGSTDGTYIVEVTNPNNPVLRDYVAGANQARIWREYKTYQNYLYIISDGGGNTLQIADLNYLPDSVHVVYDSNVIFDSGHTLYVDGDLLYVASVAKPSAPNSSMNVYSLANPAMPQLLRRLDDDYPAINDVHDMYVYNDTVFASCGYQGLYIFRFDRTTNHFQQLGSLTVYPDAGYNHSSFADQSHSVLYLCDEVPEGLAVKVVDITDLSAPTVIDTFATNGLSTPHNPYVRDNTLYIAYYQDGVQSYDISNPQAPSHNGYFDTHYQNPAGTYPSPPYQGCWGIYTDLPSGHLLASDMQLGLFVLDVSQLTGSAEITAEPSGLSVFPNPADDDLQLRLPGTFNGGSVRITDVTGRTMMVEDVPAGERHLRLNTGSLAAGLYRIAVEGSGTADGANILISR